MTTSDSIVIIPTYNEKENIEKIIRAINKLDKQFHILVIDDGSPDGTAAIVKRLMADEFAGSLFIIERKGKLGLGTAYITGPKGQVDLEEGVIVAKRHIHMTDKDAVEFGVKNGDLVSVLIENENGRKTIYGDTVIRVSPSYSLAMHIDTDESNAASCAKVQMGKIVD